MTAYGWGFALSYTATISIMLLILFRRLWLMSRRMVFASIGGGRAIKFFARQAPFTLLVALWSGFLSGTALGCLVAAAIWLLGS